MAGGDFANINLLDDYVEEAASIQRPAAEREWEVERITGRRVRDSKVEYRVKWAGFSDDESTWEPIDNFTEGSLSLIDEFEVDGGIPPIVPEDAGEQIDHPAEPEEEPVAVERVDHEEAPNDPVVAEASAPDPICGI